MIIKDHVCAYCGYVGKPTTQGLSSFLVDVLMWMVVGSVTAVTAFFPLLLLPLSWTVYHIAKYYTTTCPKCENLEMVSMTSKKGQAILQGGRGYPKAWCDDEGDVHHHAPKAYG